MTDADNTVISDFIANYLDSIVSGRCRSDQYGLAFMLDKGGYTFVAVDPDPRIDADPTSMAPRADHVTIVAHAIFKPQAGVACFMTKTMDGSAPTAHRIHNPVQIQFERDGTRETWIVSLDGIEEEEPAIVKRADPDTLTFVPERKPIRYN